MPSDTIFLARGGHEPPPDDCGNPERCLFEWYNWLARREHTDACPPGVSRVLHAFGMRLNDRLPDAKRQQLREFLPNGGPSPLDGTADDGLDEARVVLAANWAVHTGARAWLAAAGLTDELAALDAIPPITTRATLTAARPAIRAIRDRLWDKRRGFYDDLRAKVRAKLAETKPAGAVAVAAAAAAAAAVAVAVAAAAADADAAAAAAAVAVAAAAAAAAADAVAAAVAAAAADADAVAVAAAVAAADAVAAAAAVADADAAAAAAAVAVAVAAADADAAAAADADADADADAAADAVAAAAADADNPWSETYNKVYPAAKAAALKAIQDKHAPTIAATEDSAIALFRAMIRPEPHEPALD